MEKLNEAYLIYSKSHDTLVGGLMTTIPMEHSKETFHKEIVTNNKFNRKWGKGFTRELSYEERVELEVEYRRKESKSGFVSPGIWVNDIGPSLEHLDSIGIPKREFLGADKKVQYQKYMNEVGRQLKEAKYQATRIFKLEEKLGTTYEEWYEQNYI